METVWLHIRAPFAAFRQFQAGGYRSTYPVIPPSAAYGLVLNFAGIEMRGPLTGVTTSIRAALPSLRVAVGLHTRPGVAKIFQQLHSYPVGGAANQLSRRTHGAKYFISPVRRELLVGYDGVIGVQTPDSALAESVRQGVRGELELDRYGLPFLGDNNLMIDEVSLLTEPRPAWWYSRIVAGDPPRPGACRLTAAIDRLDNSRTIGIPMAPLVRPSVLPPETCWITTPDPVC